MRQDEDFDVQRLSIWCDASAALLELPIELGDRIAILANLRFIASQMQLLIEFELDDRIEPANIFRA